MPERIDNSESSTPKSPEEMFPLYTRSRKAIPNYQRLAPITQQEIGMFNGLVERKHPGQIYRPVIDPMYNCHGLTFASRRTQISYTADVLLVIKEDGYKPVDRNKVLPGDVVLYWEEDGEISHTGIVVETHDGITKAIRVWSKWSFWGKEVVHWLQDCPYGDCVRTDFYRLSPMTAGQEAWNQPQQILLS